MLDARGQSAMVEDLTGKRIASVQELQDRDDQTPIHRLAEKVRSIGRKKTGKSEAD